ncbi:MAG: type II secretion system protein, partial [Candidatus Hydrogenedentes bacterium]|nr:type II secretion system protein [Candidatus Hydrogenedentota bacterium]
LTWIDDAGTLNCVCRDPLLPLLQETIAASFNGQTQWWLVRARDLDLMIDVVRRALSNEGRDYDGDVAHLRELAEEAPVVELVSNTLAQAL